jgi:hypothetical protein
VRSNFVVLTSDFCTADRSQRSRLLGEVDRCSVGSPDSPVNFSGMALRKPESGQFARCLGLGTGQCPVHTGQCPVRLWLHQFLYAPNFVEFSQFIFFVCLC